MKLRKSRTLVSALVLGLLLGSMPGISQAAEPLTDQRRVEAASEAMVRYVKQADEPVRASVTSNYDALLAFAAAGSGGKAASPGRAWYLLDALALRAAKDADGKSPMKISGVTQAAVSALADVIMVLHAAAVYGQDTATFAGRDWPAELRAFFLPDGGATEGWLKTTLTGTAQATPRVQAQATLAFAAAGQAADAQKAATALIDRQLASGAWSSTAAGNAASFEHTVYALEAIATQNTPAASTAAANAAAYLKGQQQTDGSFTGAATPALVGRAASALRAAGETAAADRAADFLRNLQVVDSETADPLFNGAVGNTAAQRDQIAERRLAASSFSTVAKNASYLIHALGAPISRLSIDDIGQTRPAVEGNDTWRSGACEGTEGVTVVVDFADLSGSLVRCALGTQPTGWAALENAGIAVGSVPSYIGSALCQLNGHPVEGYPSCWTGQAYWSYWWATPGDLWTYSSLGASGRTPALGSVEGWRLVPLNGAGVPPRQGPTFQPGIDVTAPVMTFTSGPSGTVQGTVRWTFAWNLDDRGATQECRLDDAEWAPCDEPKTWNASLQAHTLYDVPLGDHVFSVRGTDPWGNSSVASRSFTVIEDVTAPVVTFTETPGVLTNVAGAKLAWTVDDPDAREQCSLDGAVFADCAKPTNLSGLAIGVHTFTVRASDLTGNTADHSFTWTIDADAPPVVTLTTVPKGANGLPYNSTRNQVRIVFAVAEAGTITSRECRLDDADWVTCGSATGHTFSGLALADGPHSVSVRVTNANGRTSELARYEWAVDSVMPQVRFTQQPDATTVSRSATVAWEVVDASPIVISDCKVDGGAATSGCASPLRLADLGLGTHSVNVTVRDAANNWSATTHTVSWAVERDPAVLTDAGVEAVTTQSAKVVGAVVAGNTPQAVTVEYRRAGTEDSSSVDVRELGKDESGQLETELTGLASNAGYEARLVSTSKEGTAQVASDWLTFRTLPRGAEFGTTSVSGVSPNSATIDGTLTPADLDQRVWVEYRNGDAKATSPAQTVPAGADPVALRFELRGLAANTGFSYRLVADGVNRIATEWATFATAGITSPTVSVTVSRATARVGETVTVSWKVTDAVSVQGSGGVTGDKPLSGTEQVKLTRDGVVSFTLTAVGESGATTTASAKVDVALPGKKLSTNTQKAVTIGGRSITVTASGLAAGEPYAIRISGIGVASGKASSAGSVSRKVTVPRALASMTHVVTVVGSADDRVGAAKITVVPTSKALKVKATSKVRRGKQVTVKVTKLGAYEPVTIKVGSATVKKTANSSGVVNARVTVSKKTKPGTVKVTVTGLTAKRVGTAKVKVTK